MNATVTHFTLNAVILTVEMSKLFLKKRQIRLHEDARGPIALDGTILQAIEYQFKTTCHKVHKHARKLVKAEKTKKRFGLFRV